MNNLEASASKFNLHDAEICAIRINKNDSICQIDFLNIDGSAGMVILSGVRVYRAQDVVMQNVVSRMLRSVIDSFSEEDIKYWLNWVTGLSDAPSWLKSDRMNEWVKAIAEKELELVIFEPSAGAQIVAVCEGITIRESLV